MTEIATNLRESEDLRDLLTPRRGRLGLRETDVPPAEVERQQRYGVAVKNETAGKDFRPLREKPLAVPISDGAPSLNRKSDREENVKTFWATRGAPSTLYQLLFQTDPSLEETRIGGNHLASLALALRSAK